MGSLPPFLIVLLGAALIPLFKGRLRSIYMLALPVAGFVNLLGLEHGTFGHYEMWGHDLTLYRVDKLSLVFGYIFHVAAFIGVLFGLHLKDKMQLVSQLVYAGSAIGAAFAGDLITLFLFWEIVGVSSTLLVLARRNDRAYKAALRYIMAQLVSGLLLLIGIALRDSMAFDASLALDLIRGEPSAWFIFFAFGIKCGWPLLHSWIVDAYPESTPTGAVFLSAFTTKMAVYALARAFPGVDLLIWIGAAMAVFPIFYAVIANDLRRVLCYSMINQVGFMVVGIGIGTALALNGAVAHAFADILFKGLLFMAMGAVLYRTGKIKGTDLGGLYHTMPLTTIFCCVGAASISAFPLFSGFVTKSMIMSAAASEHLTLVWFLLLFAAAGVFHHAGIKIPFFAFFAHDSGMRPKEAPPHMLAAMGLGAVLCVGLGCTPLLAALGVMPNVFYDILPFDASYVPYDTMHVVTQTQLLFYSALAFCCLMLARLYPPELNAVNVDADWWYRKGSAAFYRLVAGPLMTLFAFLSRTLHESIPGGLSYMAKNPPGAMRLAYDRVLLGLAGTFRSMETIDQMQDRLRGDQVRYEETRPGASWPIGATVLYITLAFLFFLVVYLME